MHATQLRSSGRPLLSGLRSLCGQTHLTVAARLCCVSTRRSLAWPAGCLLEISCCEGRGAWRVRRRWRAPPCCTTTAPLGLLRPPHLFRQTRPENALFLSRRWRAPPCCTMTAPPGAPRPPHFLRQNVPVNALFLSRRWRAPPCCTTTAPPGARRPRRSRATSSGPTSGARLRLLTLPSPA